MTTYKGSCHCGRVRFEVDADISAVDDCNCSLCFKKGMLYAEVPPERFRLISGEEALTLYRPFVAKHYFCKHCGCHTFIHPRSDPEAWEINVRCLEGFDLSNVKIEPFDGKGWPEA